MSRPAALRIGVLLLAIVSAGGCAASPSPSVPAGPASASAIVGPSAAPSGSAVASGSAAASASAASSSLSPAQPTTGGPVPTPTPAPTPAAPFALTSSDVPQGGAIPRRFTCDGTDVSPALAWSGVPEGTKGLALVVDDPDAHDFAHWLAYAIPSNLSHLAEGAGSPTTQFMPQGTNDFGRIGYGGPCPPSGTHHYRFTLYALAAPLGLSGAPRASAVRAALGKATVLGKATLTATYAR